MAHELARQVDDSAILSMDRYFVDKPEHIPLAEFDFDRPEAFDVQGLAADLADLEAGKACFVPEYDWTKCVRSSTREFSPPAFLIVEGLHALGSAVLRRFYDFSIFLDSPIDVLLARRILRDTQQRDRSVKFCLGQYFRYVRPAYIEFVLSAKEHADMVIRNDHSTDLCVEAEGVLRACVRQDA